jgi:hypothetical protein
MNISFELKYGSIAVDVDPRFASDLHEMLATGAMDHDQAFAMLSQIAYFEAHRRRIVEDHPGQTIVISREEIAFSGGESEAFEWVSENREAAPVYLVTLPRPEQSGDAIVGTAARPFQATAT